MFLTLVEQVRIQTYSYYSTLIVSYHGAVARGRSLTASLQFLHAGCVAEGDFQWLRVSVLPVLGSPFFV